MKEHSDGFTSQSSRLNLFSAELMCRVRELRYDFERRRGYMRLPWGNCTDMSGAIALFKRIDPRVREIDTFEEDEEGNPLADTRYRLETSGWQAYLPERPY